MHRSDIRQQPAPLHRRRGRSSSCCCCCCYRRSPGLRPQPTHSTGTWEPRTSGLWSPGPEPRQLQASARGAGPRTARGRRAAGRGAAGTRQCRSGPRAPRTVPGPLRPPTGRRDGAAGPRGAARPTPRHGRQHRPTRGAALRTPSPLTTSAAVPPLRTVPGGADGALPEHEARNGRAQRGAPRAAPLPSRRARPGRNALPVPGPHPPAPARRRGPAPLRRPPPGPGPAPRPAPTGGAAPRRLRTDRCLPRPRSGLSPLAWRGGRARRARCPSRCRSRSGLGPASWRPRAPAPMEPAAPRRPLRRADVGASAPAPPPYCA